MENWNKFPFYYSAILPINHKKGLVYGLNTNTFNVDPYKVELINQIK